MSLEQLSSFRGTRIGYILNMFVESYMFDVRARAAEQMLKHTVFYSIYAKNWIYD